MRPPPRVLLLRGGALGDLLLLRRAVASLRAGGATVGLLAPAAAEVLLGDGPAEAQEWIPWDHPGLVRLFAGEPAVAEPLADTLRSHPAAIAYTANEGLVSALRTFVPTVLSLDPARLEPGLHASLAFQAPTLALGGAPHAEPPLWQARAPEEHASKALLRALPPRFLAVHPGSGSARKNWPAESFARLIQTLTGDSPFLLVQGPADEAATLPLARARPAAVVASSLPLRVLGALLARAGLYVGNDSGVSHLAAAAGAPTLALFGPTPASVWAPVGPRVATVQAPGETEASGRLDALEVESVARRARAALRSWSLPGPPSGSSTPRGSSRHSR